MAERPPIGSVVRCGSRGAEYEVVSHQCGGGGPCYWPDSCVAAWQLKKGKRAYGPFCLDSRLLTVLRTVTTQGGQHGPNPSEP
jgi:hypothetical protein